MRHLQASALEAALQVEAFIPFAAVENALVAADSGSNVVESLDDLQPELLALLILCHRDVFNVPDNPQIVDAEWVLVSLPLLFAAGKGTYNFLSTIKAPVPTMRPRSSMTRT